MECGSLVLVFLMVSQENTYKSYIDFLKGIAILGVVLVHFNNSIPCPNYIINSASSIGARCPQLFFVISAYLTWKGLAKYPNGGDFILFLKKRFFRIAPVYYFFLILSAFVNTANGHDISPMSWILHLLFLNSLSPQYINNIMGVEWYIADLAMFYMLTPLLYKVVFNLKRAIVAFGVSLMLSVAFLGWSNFRYGQLIENSLCHEMYFHTFCIIHQMPVLLLGVIAFYLQPVFTNNSALRNKVMVCALVIILAINATFFVFDLNKIVLTSSFVFGLLFAYIFICASNYQSFESAARNKLNTFVLSLGKLSLPIYCIHIIIIRLASMLVENSTSINFRLGNWCLVFLSIVVVSYILGFAFDRSWGKIRTWIS